MAEPETTSSLCLNYIISGKLLIFCDESKLFHLVLQNENRRNIEHFGHFSEGQNYQHF